MGYLPHMVLSSVFFVFVWNWLVWGIYNINWWKPAPYRMYPHMTHHPHNFPSFRDTYFITCRTPEPVTSPLVYFNYYDSSNLKFFMVGLSHQWSSSFIFSGRVVLPISRYISPYYIYIYSFPGSLTLDIISGTRVFPIQIQPWGFISPILSVMKVFRFSHHI